MYQVTSLADRRAPICDDDDNRLNLMDTVGYKSACRGWPQLVAFRSELSERILNLSLRRHTYRHKIGVVGASQHKRLSLHTTVDALFGIARTRLFCLWNA